MDIHLRMILTVAWSIKHLGNKYPFQLKEHKELMKENMDLSSAYTHWDFQVFLFFHLSFWAYLISECSIFFLEDYRTGILPFNSLELHSRMDVIISYFPDFSFSCCILLLFSCVLWCEMWKTILHLNLDYMHIGQSNHKHPCMSTLLVLACRIPMIKPSPPKTNELAEPKFGTHPTTTHYWIRIK